MVDILGLYFQNIKGEEKLLGSYETVHDVDKAISDFLKEHNYKSYYSRYWNSGDRVKIDFGSHTQFFLVEGIDCKEYTKILFNRTD